MPNSLWGKWRHLVDIRWKYDDAYPLVSTCNRPLLLSKPEPVEDIRRSSPNRFSALLASVLSLFSCLGDLGCGWYHLFQSLLHFDFLILQLVVHLLAGLRRRKKQGKARAHSKLCIRCGCQQAISIASGPGWAHCYRAWVGWCRQTWSALKSLRKGHSSGADLLPGARTWGLWNNLRFIEILYSRGPWEQVLMLTRICRKHPYEVCDSQVAKQRRKGIPGLQFLTFQAGKPEHQMKQFVGTLLPPLKVLRHDDAYGHCWMRGWHATWGRDDETWKWISKEHVQNASEKGIKNKKSRSQLEVKTKVQKTHWDSEVNTSHGSIAKNGDKAKGRFARTMRQCLSCSASFDLETLSKGIQREHWDMLRIGFQTCQRFMWCCNYPRGFPLSWLVLQVPRVKHQRGNRVQPYSQHQPAICQHCMALLKVISLLFSQSLPWFCISKVSKKEMSNQKHLKHSETIFRMIPNISKRTRRCVSKRIS